MPSIEHEVEEVDNEVFFTIRGEDDIRKLIENGLEFYELSKFFGPDEDANFIEAEYRGIMKRLVYLIVTSGEAVLLGDKQKYLEITLRENYQEVLDFIYKSQLCINDGDLVTTKRHYQGSNRIDDLITIYGESIITVLATSGLKFDGCEQYDLNKAGFDGVRR